MRLLIVNPNSTADMTDRIGDEAAYHLPGWVELILKTNDSGPASIQGAVDGIAAVPGTLALLDHIPFDAAVIGCFDDTGLAEISGGNSLNVTGLGEAAFDAAARTGLPFAVLTTSDLSVPVLEENLQSYGLGSNCVCIRASTIDVLDFERDRETASRRLTGAGERLLKDHPEIKVIVLGCAGMGGLAAEMEKKLGVVVIDPIRATVDLVMERRCLWGK
jgi:allantoin racemase